MAANAAEWGGGEGEGWIAAEAIEVAASAVPASANFISLFSIDILIWPILI